MRNAPVAVFAYKRADALANLLRSLAKCDGYQDTEIFIFVDGPKASGDAEEVKAVRAVADASANGHVHVRASEENLGLKASISRGVTELTKTYGRVIVLEDDLEVSSNALIYFNAALDKYEDDLRVWSISGFMYAVPALSGRREAFFLPFAHPWGWATWDRAWRHYNINAAPTLENSRSRSFKEAFSMYGLANFAQMMKLAQDGLLNSWYLPWYYMIFAKGGVSLFPPRPLVVNHGIGGKHATHGSRLNPHRMLMPKAKLSDSTIELPDVVEIDFSAIDVIRRSWDARLHRLVNLGGAIKRRLK